MTAQTHRIEAVEPLRGRRLRVTWRGGARDVVNLSGLIARSRHFNVFADDAKAFAAVRPVNWGHAAAWKNGLDYSAENLAAMTAAQKADKESGAAAIRRFQDRFKLTAEDAGAVLGYKRGQIYNFRSGRNPLPRTVRMSILEMERNPAVFYAVAPAHING